MLIEQSAYSNRWRQVSPAAKGIFSLCGMVAAFAAASPGTALLVALIMTAASISGAGIPLLRYLRVAAPALFFLLASGLSLLISLDLGASTLGVSLHPAEPELLRIARVCCRSLACLAALLFLTLTTPLPDIISLLRRCKLPDTLLDLMTLCYRTLFVLSEAIHETITAQSARLGYATFAISLRSMGGLVGNLIVQVWQRSQALHLAALARNSDGALRFLENPHDNTSRNIFLAAASGSLVVALALILP
ncbi:MAG: cobalt ECF transporter T component CbiQ [Deltaproteobacteria bacterium]|nr:cobalt ECF transporter T component CbiQ [Deltaproteobacteria bacterium]